MLRPFYDFFLPTALTVPSALHAVLRAVVGGKCFYWGKARSRDLWIIYDGFSLEYFFGVLIAGVRVALMQTLVTCLTYARPREFPSLCGRRSQLSLLFTTKSFSLKDWDGNLLHNKISFHKPRIHHDFDPHFVSLLLHLPTHFSHTFSIYFLHAVMENSLVQELLWLVVIVKACRSDSVFMIYWDFLF